MFWKTFENMCRIYRETPLEVVRALGMSATNINAWKKGVIPCRNSINKLAGYFGVPSSYFRRTIPR